MKKLLHLIAILCLAQFSQFAKAQPAIHSEPSLKTQLEQVNPFWKGKEIQDAVPEQKMNIDNEVKLLQTHLSLVEKKLREKETSNLTAQQKENRLECLDYLNEYWNKGEFPTNHYHSKRTPYFIDEYNIACAVGYLIQRTGNMELTKRIQRENNNGYLEELATLYPEIESWRKTFGFEINELAWIQPCYCFTSTPAVINVSCPGGYDGYFHPDLSIVDGPPPHLLEGVYLWYNDDWNLLMCGGCDLGPGDYKAVILDNAGDSHDVYATINQPDPLIATFETTPGNTNCSSSTFVDTNGGTAPYSYSWSPSGQTTNPAIDLCDGTHEVTITDENGCVTIESTEVAFSVNLTEAQDFEYTIFPNPTSGKVVIETVDPVLQNSTVSLINLEGKVLSNGKLNDNKLEFDLSNLENGMYLISTDYKGEKSVRKIIKH